MCGVGCGLCCLTCIDTRESEVGSDDPTAHMMPHEEHRDNCDSPTGSKADSYVPPSIEEVIEGKSPGNGNGNGAGVAYGTFIPAAAAVEEEYQRNESRGEESKRVAKETTIDVDID